MVVVATVHFSAQIAVLLIILFQSLKKQTICVISLLVSFLLIFLWLKVLQALFSDLYNLLSG